MSPKKYNKLVRDKIPEIIKANGEKAVFHTADDKEYWKMLKEKMKEETEEFLKDERGEELADMLEIINAICAFKKIDQNEIEILRKKKAQDRGGFGKRIILERTE